MSVGDGAGVMFNVVSVTSVAILVLSVFAVAGFVALNFSVCWCCEIQFVFCCWYCNVQCVCSCGFEI